jgi:hypothetical protein
MITRLQQLLLIVAVWLNTTWCVVGVASCVKLVIANGCMGKGLVEVMVLRNQVIYCNHMPLNQFHDYGSLGVVGNIGCLPCM